MSEFTDHKEDAVLAFEEVIPIKCQCEFCQSLAAFNIDTTRKELDDARGTRNTKGEEAPVSRH